MGTIHNYGAAGFLVDATGPKTARAAGRNGRFEPATRLTIPTKAVLHRRDDAVRLPREGIGTHLDLYDLILGPLAAFHVPRCVGIVACPEAAALPSSFRIVDPPLH